jgi:hypothetical protein
MIISNINVTHINTATEKIENTANSLEGGPGWLRFQILIDHHRRVIVQIHTNYLLQHGIEKKLKTLKFSLRWGWADVTLAPPMVFVW